MTRRDNQNSKHHLRAAPKAAILEPLRHTITIQIDAQFSSSLSRYTEALFRTCKYRPNWPTKGFATKSEAQAWVKSFADMSEQFFEMSINRVHRLIVWR